MALDESALPELLDALRAGDGVNLIRDAVRLVMQELIELEATEHIGAGRYERSDTRGNRLRLPCHRACTTTQTKQRRRHVGPERFRTTRRSPRCG